LPSKRSNKVKASAVAPAKPASTLFWYRWRTFLAPALTTVEPMVTWPSEAITTLPSRLMAITVVACISRLLAIILQTLNPAHR
jgi:hypothetical protein